MLDRLVASGQYRVLDGRWLQDDTAGTIQSQVEHIRRYAESAGVDYLLLGSMTRFSTEERRRTFGGGFVVPLLAGIGGRKTDLVVGLTVRLVDVRTGEVATTATAQGVASRRNVSAGGFGAFARPGGGAYSRTYAGSKDALLDEAMQRAIATAADSVIKAAPRLHVER
jgi:curli biogenesis system outer membrane secretion channel CsgG